MKGIRLANKIAARCLVSVLGHDFVRVERDNGGSIESWMACWECGLTINELERQEEECKEHTMRCIRCGYPLMKERSRGEEYTPFDTFKGAKGEWPEGQDTQQENKEDFIVPAKSSSPDRF